MIFQNYLVKDGQAVPETDIYQEDESLATGDLEKQLAKSRNRILRLKSIQMRESHTYQTNAPDGSWPVERFDIVWQYFDGAIWHYTDDGKGLFTRQFAKFKEEVERPKESAPITIGDTSFTKLADGFIQILTKNGCVELMPHEIEQLSKFIK